MAEGERVGGRRSGTPNKRTAEIQQRLADMDCDPIEGMARIAQTAEVDAETSFEKYFSEFQKSLDEGAELDDLRSHIAKTLSRAVGERRNHLIPAGQMYKELANYVAPKRKAIEVSGELAQPLEQVDDNLARKMAEAFLNASKE